MKIYIKGCYSITGNLSFPEGEKFSFQVPIESEPIVFIDIYSEKNLIEAVQQRDISERVWKVLESGLVGDDLKEVPEDLWEELGDHGKSISDATRKVLSLMKYYLNNYEIGEGLFGVINKCWSSDGSDWKVYPCSYSMSLRSTQRSLQLKASTISAVQECLNNNTKPFLAFKHLFRAKEGSIPIHKWLEATIALELAIKEFYIRLKPELEPFMIEVPSPPLSKLYGSILEAYTKEKSPKLTAIKKGVEKRNELIHQPKETRISLDDAVAYTRDAETAIYHLLTLLYPHDAVYNYFYKYLCLYNKTR